MAQDRFEGFRRLSGTSQNKMMQLFRCASQDPEGHVIYVGDSGVRARPHEMRIELNKPDPRCTPITSEYDLSRELFDLGFLTHGEVPWRTFRLRPEAIAWYRDRNPLSDTETFERVGRHFYELSVGDNGREPFDPALLALRLGLSESQLKSAVRALEGAGVLIDVCSNDLGGISCYNLSKPKSTYQNR